MNYDEINELLKKYSSFNSSKTDSSENNKSSEEES